MKSNIVLQMDKTDFEALSSTYMAFDKSWDKQIQTGRFEGFTKHPGYSVIYWFDNPLSFIIAKSYLWQLDIRFAAPEDTHSDDYCIITNYEVRKGLANAV